MGQRDKQELQRRPTAEVTITGTPAASAPELVVSISTVPAAAPGTPQLPGLPPQAVHVQCQAEKSAATPTGARHWLAAGSCRWRRPRTGSESCRATLDPTPTPAGTSLLDRQVPLGVALAAGLVTLVGFGAVMQKVGTGRRSGTLHKAGRAAAARL
jgi:hypothetical protein